MEQLYIHREDVVYHINWKLIGVFCQDFNCKYVDQCLSYSNFVKRYKNMIVRGLEKKTILIQVCWARNPGLPQKH